MKSVLNKIRIIVENTDTIPGKIFDLGIQILIILSLLSFSISTLPNLTKKIRDLLHNYEIISILIFTIEYFLRVLVSNKKLKFIFSFYGIMDFLVILPFWITLTHIDLRFIRIFRLLRILRIFKLFKYNKVIKRLSSALISIYQELVIFLVLTFFAVFIASAGIYYFENPVQPEKFASIFHSGWWAISTLTTVGYGDVYPITVGGRIFTVLILFVGLGVVAMPTGLISSALIKNKE